MSGPARSSGIRGLTSPADGLDVPLVAGAAVQVHRQTGLPLLACSWCQERRRAGIAAEEASGRRTATRR